MTFEDLAFLKTLEARQLIAENEKTDPSVFALKSRNPALATQLKYWQRSKTKLPSLYAVQAIVPPLAFEQCSSELAAAAKAVEGKRCLDLTCGLGIDALHFSKHFEEVIAIEQNEVLAEVVRSNFELLGIKNVKIVAETAENYLENYKNAPFDLIYIDPARRDDRGKKVFLPEDCLPNIVELLPKLREISSRILVKMSPMYDVDAAIRQFPEATSVSVLSIDNECKEVILDFNRHKDLVNFENSINLKPTIYAKIYSKNAFLIFEKKEKVHAFSKNTEGVEYVVEPDVAFYKARMLSTFSDCFLANNDISMTSINGFFLSKNKLEHSLPARVFKIIETFDYQPKKIVTKLKQLNINALNVIQRDFSFSTQQIRTALKIKEGGDLFLICTVLEGKKMAWLAEKI